MIKENKKLYKLAFKKIKEYQHIVIFRHEVPDFDALGTQLGLMTFLRDNFPSKEIHFVGKDSPFTERFAPEMEVLDDSYFKDNEVLAIVVDTGNVKRIDDKRCLECKELIKFDHHPAVENYGTTNIVVDELSSASELLCDFIFSQKKYLMSKTAAMYFYIGLVGDTGRFLYPATTEETFKVAAKLISTGFNPSFDVYNRIYVREIKDLKVMQFILNNFKLTDSGVAYYVINDNEQKELGITSSQAKEHISMLRDIKGIKIVVSIAESKEEKEWRVSIRSKNTKINHVAEIYRGGGHLFASGAKLKSIDELPNLIKDLEGAISENEM